ncbi:uncharacterized protein NEMAJ01_1948 [Nematocida major]|uniref:uncharacterized protein n=1 Tax=Nematocida major TaxID=1912982 RepID=UPI0020084741|nr:uncharacterized protein NEMAJ01_1948 [Nematocida major]KAH9387052.1 hypothetical protein NEMAJ01_1948 [Nematocida major]
MYIVDRLKYESMNHWHTKKLCFFRFLAGRPVEEVARTMRIRPQHPVKAACVVAFYHQYSICPRTSTHDADTCPLFLIFNASNRAFSVFLLASYHIITPLATTMFAILLLSNLAKGSASVLYLGLLGSYGKFMGSCLYNMFLLMCTAAGAQKMLEILNQGYTRRLWGFEVHEDFGVCMFYVELLILALVQAVGLNFCIISGLNKALHFLYILCIWALYFFAVGVAAIEFGGKVFDLRQKGHLKRWAVFLFGAWFMLSTALFLGLESYLGERRVSV